MRNKMFSSCQRECRFELNPTSGEVNLLLITLSLGKSTDVCVWEHAAVIFMAACTYSSHTATTGSTYKGVSKSPRTMLITRKSLVVHEFPARVCCGGVLWVSVPSGMVGCGSVWLLHVSLCVYCISRLRFSDIGGIAEVDEHRVCIKFCVRLGKTGSKTFEMLKQAFWWFVHEP